MSERPRPSFACKRWGSYEHDWMDCPECITNYESELEYNNDRGTPRDDSKKPATS